MAVVGEQEAQNTASLRKRMFAQDGMDADAFVARAGAIATRHDLVAGGGVLHSPHVML